MRRLVFPVVFSALSLSAAFSQSVAPGDQSSVLSVYKSPKRPGHYTTSEWRALIDSLWGPGLPTATKLEIFDTFWGRIDAEYGGFPHLEVNWDSLRAKYRPEIEGGVSRGRFAGILTVLSMALREVHTGIQDRGVDSVAGFSVKDLYLPGIPHFYPSGWGWAGNFGAALTPLPDSSLLVYKTVASHPLGLVPGDVVLGYDRIPWKRLCQELLEAELPIQFLEGSTWGSTPRSWTHGLLGSAGNHWGLYDTIDVVKYGSGDTLHLSTVPLAGQQWRSLLATEQVAVPGVRIPDYAMYESITSGVIENTTVGYVYVHSWLPEVAAPFAAAVNDLVNVKKVSGLILDFRYNRGGNISAWVPGLDYLFNQNPAGATRWKAAVRADPLNHLGFSFESPYDAQVSMKADYYSRPIAALIGPHAMSQADKVPFVMRFHPMARLFGQPTNGAFTSPGTRVYVDPAWGSWYYGFATAQMVSLLPGEGFLMHKSFPVDQEIWLGRDGVARGVDDVVKRALEWITTLTHAHSLSATPSFARPGLDTVTITAVLANPMGHHVAVSLALVPPGGGARDSFALHNDGLHGDGLAGDSIWGARYFPASSVEGFYAFDMRTENKTEGSSRVFPALNLFTTAGPGKVDSATLRMPRPGQLRLTLGIRNRGQQTVIPDVRVRVSVLDTSHYRVLNDTASFGDIGPAERIVRADAMTFALVSGSPAGPVNMKVEIQSSGITYWTENIAVTDMDSHEMLSSVPKVLALRQNYPNPFNPNTTITFELPKSSMVRLSVYDMLGREVSVLVNERRDAGVHEIVFDASALSSGMYFYRMKAGEFVQTRRMLLLK